ncbi:MAG: hypothetical protein SF053_07500 [Bacteroidia bacterium]|nr:hypothetical protein [Bacteroidia bacterium]
MTTGAALVLGTLYFVASTQALALMSDMADLLLAIAGVAALGGAGLGYYLTRQQLQALDTNAPPEDRLYRYRTISLVQYALAEAPILISAVCYFLSPDNRLLAVGVLAMLWMISLHPTPTRVGSALSLTEAEQALLTAR